MPSVYLFFAYFTHRISPSAHTIHHAPGASPTPALPWLPPFQPLLRPLPASWALCLQPFLLFCLCVGCLGRSGFLPFPSCFLFLRHSYPLTSSPPDFYGFSPHSHRYLLSLFLLSSTGQPSCWKPARPDRFTVLVLCRFLAVLGSTLSREILLSVRGSILPSLTCSGSAHRALPRSPAFLLMDIAGFSSESWPGFLPPRP